MEMTRPPNEKMFSEKPASFIRPKFSTSVSGMAMIITSTWRKLPRKR